MKSQYRGHEMYFDEQVQHWRFSNDGSIVSDGDTDRCGVCHENRTPEGHDPCIGTLAGVINACCGHGEVDCAYVVFCNGKRVAGAAAISHFQQSQPLESTD